MAKAIEIPDCGSVPAAVGAMHVLRTRLDEMLSFRDAALDWGDPEGVHDMRVASRRLRSIARDFGRYLPKVQLKKFRRGVKKLADALGEVRDEDVALAAVEAGIREAPPELAAGFESVAAPKRARRKRARVQLFGALEAETFAGFGEELAAALKPRNESAARSPDKPDDAQPNSEENGPDGVDSDAGAQTADRSTSPPQTFREVGREVIERHLRQLVKLSESLFRPHDSEGLHDLRIAAKELRYALELFSGCWGGQLKPYAKEIARLQSSLGHVHDCDGWIRELGKRLAAGGDKGESASSDDGRAASSDDRPTSARALERRAALWLFRRYAAERAAQHAEALARWHAWENYNLLAHIRESLRHGVSAEATETARPAPEHAGRRADSPEGQSAEG